MKVRFMMDKGDVQAPEDVLRDSLAEGPLKGVEGFETGIGKGHGKGKQCGFEPCGATRRDFEMNGQGQVRKWMRVQY
jgi:hypothetical protein